MEVRVWVIGSLQVRYWDQKDHPITRFALYLTNKGLWSEQQEKEWKNESKKQVKLCLTSNRSANVFIILSMTKLTIFSMKSARCLHFITGMKCVSVHCHSASWKHLDFLKNNLKFVESQPFTPNYSVESPPGADPNQYQSHPDHQRNNISWELGNTESHQKECESHHETTLQNYLGSPEDKGSSFCSCLPLSPHWSEWCMIIMLELSEIDHLFPHFIPKLAVWHDRFWTEIANIVYSWNRDSNRH